MTKVFIDGAEYVPAKLVEQIRNIKEADMLARLPHVREESESSLFHRAQLSISRTNWEVGEAAAIWSKRFSRSRSDADFAAVCGLSADQVYQRRRVWEAFADVYQNYPRLRWGHFYAAMEWDDASTCLQWANDVEAGVAEMKAWRRAQRGEDLCVEPMVEALE